MEKGLRDEPSNYYYFFEQLTKFGVGLVLALITWFVPMSVVRRWKYIVFVGTLILVLLLFTPLGITLNGSSAWLDVPGGTIQPGEFFKIGFVMFLGSWLIRKRNQMDDMSYYM